VIDFPSSDNKPTPESVLVPRDVEETLVTDHRATLTPSQQVEQKLIGMLKASPLLISHVQRRMTPGTR